MKLHRFSTTHAAPTVSATRLVCKLEARTVPTRKKEAITTQLLNRQWMLEVPDSKIQTVKLTSDCETSGMLFYVVRDDLLHPLVNGNKARKLDALIPLLVRSSVTDVVTCGGCQSAHSAAVVSCAERGIKSHLLLRGEQPEVLTGYNMISTLYGNVTYIPRSVYANRETMLKNHADLVAGNDGQVVSCKELIEVVSCKELIEASLTDNNTSANLNFSRKVVIVNEGAGDAVALLGVIRLVKFLSHILGKERPVKLVVDAGTGTTAIGLGLGALCLGLSWEVTAVMLADIVDAYKQKEKHLISDFKSQFVFHNTDHLNEVGDRGIIQWVPRCRPRKFGKVLKGEMKTCQDIARQTGILVDPIYTLAAWEIAAQLSKEEMPESARVVMLHTGGTLGMFGLAQRYNI